MYASILEGLIPELNNHRRIKVPDVKAEDIGAKLMSKKRDITLTKIVADSYVNEYDWFSKLGATVRPKKQDKALAAAAAAGAGAAAPVVETHAETEAAAAVAGEAEEAGEKKEDEKAAESDSDAEEVKEEGTKVYEDVPVPTEEERNEFINNNQPVSKASDKAKYLMYILGDENQKFVSDGKAVKAIHQVGGKWVEMDAAGYRGLAQELLEQMEGLSRDSISFKILFNMREKALRESKQLRIETGETRARGTQAAMQATLND